MSCGRHCAIELLFDYYCYYYCLEQEAQYHSVEFEPLLNVLPLVASEIRLNCQGRMYKKYPGKVHWDETQVVVADQKNHS